MPRYRISVAGAGIYGATIAIKLADAGHKVTLFDPLGLMQAASAINQFRVHAGYHYPRSLETIYEVIEAREGFLSDYASAIVKNVQNFYAIPYLGSKTSPERFESVISSVGLPFEIAKPAWINFDFIDRCYRVNEEIYDPVELRAILHRRIKSRKIDFVHKLLTSQKQDAYDFTVFATYGGFASYMHLFDDVRIQVVEKIKVRLPNFLANKSLVVIDGPFTAFDPYGASGLSQFGSALYTTHWTTADPNEPIPEHFKGLMNSAEPIKCDFSNFQKMRKEATQVVPACHAAKYISSSFTRRVIEYNPSNDRRVMRIEQTDRRTFHVFSGKVVGATKAARIICEKIANA